jgi:prepilin-type N-terminal cleavage/methylation domain-containing protein
MKKIMELLQNMKAKNEKKDNKGFSLVELIIVIAIMAILVGIVGTQVLPYIEKSKKAKDIQKISGLCTDASTAYSSTASELSAASYKITIDKTAAIAVTGGSDAENDALKKAFVELNSVDKTGDLKLESKAGKNVTKIEITCKDTSPMVEVVTTVNDSATNGSFEKIESK